MSRTVNILWTGGLDSSFRVIELSQIEGLSIQPWYIVDPVRNSLKNELRAIHTITDIVRKHPRTKSNLLDLKTISLNEILPDERITAAFNRLHDKHVIGHQYDLIARYAAQHNIRFEMSLEKSDRSKAYACVETELKLVSFQDGDYSVLRADTDASSCDGKLIYSNIDLPTSLWGMTKLEEVEKLRTMGHGDTVKHTWFCHSPAFGHPCGHCNPCRDSINEGLAFRVPLSGRLLYYIHKPWQMIACRLKKH